MHFLQDGFVESQRTLRLRHVWHCSGPEVDNCDLEIALILAIQLGAFEKYSGPEQHPIFPKPSENEYETSSRSFRKRRG